MPNAPFWGESLMFDEARAWQRILSGRRLDLNDPSALGVLNC
jgi:hypothetical protein